MTYKCYILDDEPLALNVIEQHLSKFEQFEVCGKSTEPLQALGQIKALQPDLLFLDIQMPELTGLDLIESIQNKPAIIITTAYREYAVEGFELNVLDYLVKPIPFKRFIKAIDKFLEQKIHKPAAEISPVPPTLIEATFLLIKAERKTIKVAIEDILYVEGVKDYVKIVLRGQKIMTKTSIGNFFNELPSDRFVRIHKSFVVAIDKIEAYTAHDVEIQKMELPIGRMYKEAFIGLMEGR
ncbi:MAG: response regulator [Haliscomenobacter sp.]|uniref:LytR/AlgR family response regulator transcription factor n=1 Tax=Haliscomenobacter sp. TaxID=2717303 RepID=UPI0029AB760A|nr:response regulator [Haliscomenobacter sp.]MDX2068502.1 response regulator [Haliscomenobacter sp.]